MDCVYTFIDLPTSESVVFSNAVTDHVVTITTQPADGDLDAINQENLLKIDGLLLFLHSLSLSYSVKSLNSIQTPTCFHQSQAEESVLGGFSGQEC